VGAAASPVLEAPVGGVGGRWSGGPIWSVSVSRSGWVALMSAY